MVTPASGSPAGSNGADGNGASDLPPAKGDSVPGGRTLEDFPPPDEWIARVGDLPLVHQPGERRGPVGGRADRDQPFARRAVVIAPPKLDRAVMVRLRIRVQPERKKKHARSEIV